MVMCGINHLITCSLIFPNKIKQMVIRLAGLIVWLVEFVFHTKIILRKVGVPTKILPNIWELLGSREQK